MVPAEAIVLTAGLAVVDPAMAAQEAQVLVATVRANRSGAVSRALVRAQKEESHHPWGDGQSERIKRLCNGSASTTF